jgi:hypothetical protein
MLMKTWDVGEVNQTKVPLFLAPVLPNLYSQLTFPPKGIKNDLQIALSAEVVLKHLSKEYVPDYELVPLQPVIE